jgi:hypothetical protein
MAMTAEGKVKKRVTEILKLHEVYYFFPAANGYGKSGVPDIICCVNGMFLAIECKAEGGRTTALQDRELERIESAGGIPLVVTPEHLEKLPGIIKNLQRPY